MTTIPAYTIGGITRPELQLDSTGHIVLDSAADAFVAQYGLQYLYLGCPPGTPWPPVTDSLSTPVNVNAGNDTVAEGAAVNTLVNITAQATSSGGNPVTYSLIGDTSNGGFKINPNTGVVSVADPSKINYVTSPGHAYTITVQANDGVVTSSQSFTIGVTDVAPSTPVDSNAAPNKVADGAAVGTLVGITASATDMNAVTYSLTGDSSGGGFTINATTGVITVADPSKINYATAPGHAYTVTATASDGTLSSSQTFTIDVTLGAATHFAVSIAPSGTAGTPGTVTVTALDALNNVVTNYSGTVHFTSSDGQAVLPANMTLTNGVGSFGETLKTAGSQTITATDTVSGASGTSNAETVTPGVATHFAVSIPPNGAAGTAGTATVTALDAYGNVATSYSGTVHFTSSDPSAVLPANMTLTHGVATFSETLDTVGSQTVTATDTVNNTITGTSNAETVGPGAATHFVVTIPGTGASGTPGTVTVTAYDAFGDVATGYTGTVHFTSSDGHAVLPANMTLTNGVGTFSETLDTVGSQTITATDTVNTTITGTSNAETVGPGPATHFVISIPSSGTAGTQGLGLVTAYDAHDNIVTNYSGTVHFTSSDGLATLPANMTLANGVGSFTETLETAGSQTITATDTVNSSVTGTSNAETVGPGPATHFVISIPADGTSGTPGVGTVTALDAHDNVVTNYTGTVHFTSSDGSAVLPANMTLANGVGSFTETLETAGSQTITATDTVNSAITGTSNAETVAPAAAAFFAVTIPASGTAGAAGTVKVTALDAFGNVATGYSGTVHFTSSDGSAVLPADVTLTNGVGTFNETLDTVGSQTITATDTVNNTITGTSNAETVGPGPATHFAVTIPASGTAGTAGSVTVTALDAFGNTATGYSGTVHFTSSDGSAVLPANMTLTNGVGTFSETLDTVGSQTITATDTVSSSVTGTSNAETVGPGPATHFVISIPADGTSGTPGVGTVTALDAHDNVVTNYTGTVHFTSSDGSAVLPGNMTLTNGVGSFTETLETAGSQTITATDTVNNTITGTSNAETVGPGPATHFLVNLPASGTAGTPDSGTVTALDAHNNVVTDYSGTVHFTSTDGQAVLPADMTLTNGVATFSETLDTAGSQTITATDTVNNTITGTSNAESVGPGPATHFVVTIPASGRADAPGSVTVTAYDADNNIATGYSGTVHFTSSDGSAVLPANATLTNGTGTFSETFETTGSQTITATDTVNTAITGTSNAETVGPADAPPVVTGGHTLSYTQGQAATAIDPALTVTDSDSADLAQATVQITGNYVNGQDVLSFVNTAHITGSFNTSTGTLTLTGTDTVADYQAALESVTYFNSSQDPSALARTVTIIASDGIVNSTPATDTITVTPVDNPPVNTVPGAQTVLENQTLTFSSANGNAMSISDPEVPTGNLQVTVSVLHGTLALSETSGLTVTGDSTGTVELTGSQANINAALAGLVYTPTTDTSGSDTLTIATDDLGNTGLGPPLTTTSTVGITVTPVNQPPSFTLSANERLTTETTTAHSVSVANFVTNISPGPPNESSQTVHFNVTGDTNPSMFSVAPTISANGTLSYTLVANYAGTATITIDAQDNGGTANGGHDTSATQTFAIDVSPVANTPTISDGSLQPTAVTSQYQVNTTTGTGIAQNTAAVTALSGGGYVVAWQDTQNDALDARIYNASGTPIGNDFHIGFDPTDTLVYASNVVDLKGMPTGSPYAGGFLEVDVVQNAGLGTEALEGRIITSTGTVTGPGNAAFQISPASSDNDLGIGPASAAVFSNGSFVVAWEDVTASNQSTIEVQRYNANGSPVHQDGSTSGLAEFQVSQSTGVSEDPDVTVLSNGNFVVAWDYSTTGGLGTQNVYYQVYSSAGATIGGVTMANTSTGNEQDVASITALANGGFAITWESVSAGGDGIYTRIFNASGTATTGEILVNTATTDTLSSSSIVGLPDGGFLVTWDDSPNSGGDSGDVYGQRFDANGNKVGGQFLINQTTAGSQEQNPNFDHNPITVLNSGQLVSVWTSQQNGSTESDIYARNYSIPGDGPENGTVTLDTISALVSGSAGTSATNGGLETIQEIDLSGLPTTGFTFSVGHAGSTAGTWVINNAADIASLATTALTMTAPAGYSGNFTLSVTAIASDTATLSTGNVTSTATSSTLTIPVGVKAPGDPIFAADSANPFSLNLDPVASGDTVAITSLPGNGSLEYADGTLVAAGAILTAAQFAGLKFAPLDLGSDTSADLTFTVSDGTTDTVNTVPINLVHGTGVTITGDSGNDHIIGSPGADILIAGSGQDILTGGGGADRFVFNTSAPTDTTTSSLAIDQITDYSAAGGDTIDLTSLFSAATIAHTDIASLVKVTEDAGGTSATLQINTATSGQAAHWVSLVKLDGMTAGAAVNVEIDAAHPNATSQVQSTPASGSNQVASQGSTPPSPPAGGAAPVPSTPVHTSLNSGGFDFSSFPSGSQGLGNLTPTHTAENTGGAFYNMPSTSTMQAEEAHVLGISVEDLAAHINQGFHGWLI